eukprot:11449767-Heterocapsa_arctica.AAC.1
MHTTRHPVPPAPEREQPAPRATVDPRRESPQEAPQEDDADDIDPDADVVIDADVMIDADYEDHMNETMGYTPGAEGATPHPDDPP